MNSNSVSETTTWFTMLIGIPGSGKSSFLKKAKANKYGYIVCPDSIRENFTGDISNQSQNQTVWQIAQYTTLWALTNSFSVVLDAVNTDTVLRRNFVSQLFTSLFPIRPDVKRRAIIFDIFNPEVAIKRVTERQVGARVPNGIIYRMYGEFLYTMKIIEQENWDEITYIAENSNG